MLLTEFFISLTFHKWKKKDPCKSYMNSQTPICKIISTNAGHQLPPPEMTQKYVGTT